MKITPTEPEELGFVIAAERAAHARDFVVVWSREEHAAAITDPDQEHLIIRAGGERCGFVLLAGLRGVHRGIELRRIVVTTPGRGLGRRALELVLTRAFVEHRAHRVWLDVKPHNDRARRLYAAVGFVEEGVLRDALSVGDRYESLVVMSVLRPEWRDR